MLRAILLAMAFLVVCFAPALAQPAPHCAPGQLPEYVFGFKALHDLLGATMGDPVTCEFSDPNGTGDTHQVTTKGLAFWRKSTNTPTFTNGSEHWALTAQGLVSWTGPSIDPPTGSSVTPAPEFRPPCQLETDAVMPRPSFRRQPDGSVLVVGPVRNSCEVPIDLELQWFATYQVNRPAIDAPTTFVHDLRPGEIRTLTVRIPESASLSGFALRKYWHAVSQRTDFCLSVGTTACLLADPWLHGTLEALRVSEDGLWLLRVAAENGVTIRREPTDIGVLGKYHPATKTIVIDTRLDAYSTWVRAAVLAHELQHAADDAAGRWPQTVGDCYRSEEDAFRRQASVWRHLWSDRLPPDLDVVHAELNDIALTVARDPVGFALTLVPRYHDQCADGD